jgi:hypothetical protein
VQASNCQGSKTFPDGNNYVGEFKDDKFNGQGTFTSANGTKYVGEFKDGNRSGKGTYTFTLGNKYVGEFKDDNFNGQGTYSAANGSIISSGIWVNGSFVGTVADQEAIRMEENGGVYVGHKNHGGVTMAVPIASGGFDQLFDLSFGEVLSAAKLAVRPPSRGNCSFFGGWRDQLQVRFGHGFRLLAINDCSYNTHFTSSGELILLRWLVNFAGSRS